MKHKLLLQDRFTLLGVLPEKGNFATLKIVRKLRETLSCSEEEMQAVELTQKGENVKWNPQKDKKKEVEIGEIAAELIKKTLKELNDKEELTPNHFTIYEIFVEEKPKQEAPNGDK